MLVSIIIIIFYLALNKDITNGLKFCPTCLICMSIPSTLSLMLPPIFQNLVHHRDLTTEKTRLNIPLKKEVIGRTASSKAHVLADFNGTMWSLMNSEWLLQIKKTNDDDKHVLELRGPRKVFIFLSV